MEDNGDKILEELFEEQAFEEAMDRVGESLDKLAGAPTVTPAAPAEEGKPSKSDSETHTQWALGGNGRFVPVGSTTPQLKSGIYECFATPGMWGLERLNISSDGIYTLPDMATETVMTEVNKFWSSEDRYRKHKLLYKRGIILWGPPGGGKTVTCKLLMNELVKREGIVVVAQNIGLTIMCLKAIRRIEPNRNLIVVLEDIDEIISHNGESSVLSMLDGENNVDNILHLATTNYPERLGARIINRPSRFDRRVYVGLPEDPARRAYLDKVTNGELNSETLAKWVEDTKNMSIAHLRELVAAVYCLEQPYEEVLERLKKMAEMIKSDEEFKRKSMGFKSPNMSHAMAGGWIAGGEASSN